ncbi:MAG: helix-turn-helix transcriptional regulator [Leptolyngbyaceae cyanobacterium SU_3_3]|nr:helix-turn-helix transcriptional regulator [Leptolyngbyaceae cyanobacterium SU_3_3]
MGITLSGQTYDALFEEMLEQACYPDPEDETDVIIPFPTELGRGSTRLIDLREGFWIEIDSNKPFNDLKLSSEEYHEPDCLRVGMHLSGVHRSSEVTVGPGEYSLGGSGAIRQGMFDAFAEPLREVTFQLAAEQVRSFFGEVPIALQRLIAPADQLAFVQAYRITPAMYAALQQLLQCPYRGVMKQRYLETKVWELFLLSVEPLLVETPLLVPEKLPKKLKSDQVDRIHAARKILLQRLDHPPSLLELARLVGLNDRLLKEGFRACFGTTPFHYLHHYRLEQAQQLLAQDDLKIEVVARRVGFANRSHFAEAFRKKFGMNPGEYARQQRRNAKLIMISLKSPSTGQKSSPNRQS